MTDITQQLALWIEQLRAVAQTGLAFNPPLYDRERYDGLLELASRMAATLNSELSFDPQLAEAYSARWRSDVRQGVPGYVTPKVGVGAIVFNDHDEILLIKRPEGGWLFPTGWADIGFSPAQIAVKEVREETGLDVTPTGIVGVYDSAHWRKGITPQFYSIVFYCKLIGGELRRHPLETLDVGFFARDSLPEPLFRTSTDWVSHAWAAHRGNCIQAYFDR